MNIEVGPATLGLHCWGGLTPPLLAGPWCFLCWPGALSHALAASFPPDLPPSIPTHSPADHPQHTQPLPLAPLRPQIMSSTPPPSYLPLLLPPSHLQILRNTLYKAYLDDFQNFVDKLGGSTQEVMGDLLAFEVSGRGGGRQAVWAGGRWEGGGPPCVCWGRASCLAASPPVAGPCGWQGGWPGTWTRPPRLSMSACTWTSLYCRFVPTIL